MGIRFHCSGCGHKLNVKAFQGGRRGLCPYCGASIQIPTKSTRLGSKRLRQAHDSPQASGSGAAMAQPPSRGAEASPSPRDPQVDSPPTVSPQAHTAGLGASPVASPGSTAPGGTSQPAGPRSNEALGPTPAQPVGETPVFTDPQGATPTSGEVGMWPSPVDMAGASGPVQAAVPGATDPAKAGWYDPATPAQAPPRPPAQTEALAEAPDAVWYLRPPSGGQYGPATGDTMRTWIAEGRVTPDCLVWREGWRDWQTALDVFPQLGAWALHSELGAIAPSQTPGGGAATGDRRPSRHRSVALNAAIITFLVLAVIVLLGVFIWVLKGGPARLGDASRRGSAIVISALQGEPAASSLPAASRRDASIDRC
jgi:DNA-directed RNA polymerase subunit RPC12/RpoP